MSKNKNAGVDREALYHQQQKDAALKQKTKRQRQQAAEQEQEAFSRPPQRMRPENEVIARIKHSAPSMTANCTIGYMDRFKGLQTAPFELFFSGHEDYVDVPMHRIRHIKYYDRTIWDREARIDQVFQSTPASSHTLDYWLEHEQELRDEQEKRIQQEKARAALLAAHEQSFVSAIRADIDRQRAELQAPSTSIPIEIRTRTTKPTSTTSTRKNPNHFISFRITNTDILSQLANVQQALLSYNAEYKAFLIPNGSFHLTLCLLCLTSQEEITRASNILSSLESSLRSMMRTPLSLPLTGCSSFGGRVIYVDTITCDALTLLQSYRDTLQRAFIAAGLHVCEAERHWTPHLTIAKMSRSRNQKIKKIDAAAYSSHVSHHFGMQAITHLEFCSMMGKKRQDGYYHVWKQIIVNNTVREYTIQEGENQKNNHETMTDTNTGTTKDASTTETEAHTMEIDTDIHMPTSSPPLIVSISATQSYIATTVFGSPCIITHSPTDTAMSQSQDITSTAVQAITSTTITTPATVIAPASTPASASPSTQASASASTPASASASATRRPRRVRHDE